MAFVLPELQEASKVVSTVTSRTTLKSRVVLLLT